MNSSGFLTREIEQRLSQLGRYLILCRSQPDRRFRYAILSPGREHCSLEQAEGELQIDDVLGTGHADIGEINRCDGLELRLWEEATRLVCALGYFSDPKQLENTEQRSSALPDFWQMNDGKMVSSHMYRLIPYTTEWEMLYNFFLGKLNTKHFFIDC